RFSSNALSRMGRRGFLKTLAGLGVSASAASVLTQEAVADVIDDPRREVPRIKAFRHTNHEAVVEEGAKPEREPDIYSIPRSMWARVEAAHDARRQVEKQLDGNYPVWVTDDNNGDKMVVVEQYDDGNLRSADVRALDEQIPASVKGVAGRRSRFGWKSRYAQEREIPVDIKRPQIDGSQKENSSAEQSKMAEDYSNYSLDSSIKTSESIHYEYDYEEIPAGSHMYATDSDMGNATHVTTGFPVYDDTESKILSAGHTFDSQLDRGWVDDNITSSEFGGDLHEEEVVFDPFANDEFDPLDAALMEIGPSASGTKRAFAANGGGYRWTSIWGSLTLDRLNDIQDSGTGSNGALIKQGSINGRDECSITAVTDRAFKTDLVGGDDIEGGDSGGPIAEVREVPWMGRNIAYAAGLISSNLETNEYVYGSAMHAVEDEFTVIV
ncbi:trypsin-like serine protease, partial [Halodesulfurarchaeum sp.]|uniref:trypsin-like serine protease n=1 Tax=Halodesulfurarchaeum sp. TaxID=1980530 RepID=UPI002FC3B526